MKVSERMTITKRSTDGAFYGEKDNAPYIIERTHADYNVYDGFYNVMRSTAYADRPRVFRELLDNNRYPAIFGGIAEENPAPAPAPDPKKTLMDGIRHLMDFFTEFSFTPSFRFTNTFAYMACKGKQDAIDYVCNYFALMDSSYIKEVEQKVKSAEFGQIIKDIAQYGEPTSHINTRFKVYFGPAGTGKTTIAQEESENRCIVCNSSMLPSDLMEDFKFEDGKAAFKPSVLWTCMENGEQITLDEINLLPFDSLRFLQGILDGKSEFTYKNKEVHIKDGFKVVGTMNLSVNGITYGLPEPLVDRCEDMREFKLTAKDLTGAF